MAVWPWRHFLTSFNPNNRNSIRKFPEKQTNPPPTHPPPQFWICKCRSRLIMECMIVYQWEMATGRYRRMQRGHRRIGRGRTLRVGHAVRQHGGFVRVSVPGRLRPPGQFNVLGARWMRHGAPRLPWQRALPQHPRRLPVSLQRRLPRWRRHLHP